MVDLPASATARLRDAVARGAERARRDGRPPRAAHLLLGLLEEDTGVAATVLARLAVDSHALRDRLEARLSGTDAPPGERPGEDAPAERILALAREEAAARGHHYLGQEHLLLGLLREPDSATARVLATVGVTYDRGADELTTLFRPPHPDTAQPA